MMKTGVPFFASLEGERSDSRGGCVRACDCDATAAAAATSPTGGIPHVDVLLRTYQSAVSRYPCAYWWWWRWWRSTLRAHTHTGANKDARTNL